MTLLAFLCLVYGLHACEPICKKSLLTSPSFKDIHELLSEEELEELRKLYKTQIEEEMEEEEKSV